MKRRTLSIDFDGVLHSYESGWEGVGAVSDPPVPGAIQFLVDAVNDPDFKVCIFSTRNRQWRGRKAMRKWLSKHLTEFFMNNARIVPTIVGDVRMSSSVSEAEFYAQHILYKITFPLFKPKAHVTLDDRALTFNGYFPTMQRLKYFKPWNKKGTRRARQ